MRRVKVSLLQIIGHVEGSAGVCPRALNPCIFMTSSVISLTRVFVRAQRRIFSLLVRSRRNEAALCFDMLRHVSISNGRNQHDIEKKPWDFHACRRFGRDGAFVGSAPAFAQAVIIAPVAPPPPRVEVVPRRLVRGYVGIRAAGVGIGRYVWVPGHWQAVRVGYHWVPGHWVQRGPNWRWVEGHWA